MIVTKVEKMSKMVYVEKLSTISKMGNQQRSFLRKNVQRSIEPQAMGGINTGGLST